MEHLEEYLSTDTIKLIKDIALIHGGEGEVLRTYAMTDIHGLSDTFALLLRKINENTKKKNTPSRFVFLGDYVDRGFGSAQVVSMIRLLQKIMPPGRVIALRGNHDQMFLDNQANPESYTSFSRGLTFLEIQSKFYGDPIKSVPISVVEWFNSLPYYYEDKLHYYVHAGFLPGYSIENQLPEWMLWIRNEFLRSYFDFGKEVFHGHTPNSAFLVEQKAYRTNLDTGGVFGGYLTAAEIKPDKRKAIRFLQVECNARKMRL